MDIADRIADLTAEISEARKATLRETRAPSIAHLLGEKGATTVDTRAFGNSPTKAWLDSTVYSTTSAGSSIPGDLILALSRARGSDATEQAIGKATLEGLGLRYADAPAKATLGNGGPQGGYVLPNNLVDSVLKPATAQAVYSQLVTLRSGVAVRGVDVPYRTSRPDRATFSDWGTTKENVNEVYGSYTATLGTMARIYDVGAQYLRFSAGAAEQDVMDELARAFRLGENYSILAGPGTGASTPGTGDPTLGVYTALAATSSWLPYTTANSGASNSTIAGSAGRAFASSFKALAKRSVNPSAIVTDAATYWDIFAEGTDTAGFWVTPGTMPRSGFTVNASGGLAFWGVPILWDPNFDANTSTTKAAIVADWSVFKLYRGLEFRIDTSAVAGDRWDKNLVGFRGEEEIGFNASPGVNAGYAQLVTSVVP